jgi:hypothetical protein
MWTSSELLFTFFKNEKIKIIEPNAFLNLTIYFYLDIGYVVFMCLTCFLSKILKNPFETSVENLWFLLVLCDSL